MKGNTYSYKKLFGKLNSSSIFLLLFFPIIPILLNSYIIGLVLFISLTGIFIEVKKQPCISIQKPWIIAISYIILVISLLYTENIKEGFYAIEKRAVLVLFPLVFLLRKEQIKEKYIKIAEFSFILLIFIWFTILNVNIFISIKAIINEGVIVNNWRDALNNESFSFYYRSSFEKYSGLHPTYACLFSLFSLGVLIVNIFLYKTIKQKIYRAGFIIIGVLLLLYSLFLAAKGPIVAFIISILIIFFIKLKKKQFFLIAASFILIFTVSVIFLPPLKKRVSELFYPQKSEVISSVSIRKIIFKSSVELAKESGLIGFGVGDVQEKLDKEYAKYGEEKLVEDSLNTHNEYMNLLLSAGIVGILSLLVAIIIPLIDSIKERDYRFVFFLVLISVSFLFENILSRQKGILFFTFFYLFYYYHQIDNRKCRQDIQNI